MPEVYDQTTERYVWMEYDDYLQTEWWRTIRRKRIEIDGKKCTDCGITKNLVVHHLTYERLGREDIEDLVTLCDKCHKLLHRNDDAAIERRAAAFVLAQNPDHEKRMVYTLGFVGFVAGECEARGLNPRALEVLKSLRTEYCGLFGIGEDDIRILTAQDYFAMTAHKHIDLGVLNGSTAKEIAKTYGIRIETVKKRLGKLRKIGEEMKKLDLSNVEAMEPGGRDRIEAGGYVVRIIDIDDHEEKEFLWLVFDIAEGEKKGFYTNDANGEYYADKPNKHGILLSYKQSMSDNAKRMLKGKLKKFSDFNPGFDAEAAWDACKPELFVGKLMGLAAGMEEYVYEGRDDGKWRKGESIDWFHARWYSPEYIREGRFNVPETVELSDEDAAKIALQDSGASVSSVYDDIPFE